MDFPGVRARVFLEADVPGGLSNRDHQPDTQRPYKPGYLPGGQRRGAAQ